VSAARLGGISDNDYFGDPDGLFKPHHLLSPSVDASPRMAGWAACSTQAACVT
jgi:hypothetical protein